jgi:hypothetical protein
LAGGSIATKRQQLQHMVLDHVAQRARAVIKADPAFKADRFRDGDLDMVDMRRVPQRFEQDIGKAQRQQVLHRFLAEIVIDPEGAVLRKRPRDRIVDVAA